MRISKGIISLVLICLLWSSISCQAQQELSSGVPVTPEMLESVSRSLAETTSASEISKRNDENVSGDSIVQDTGAEFDPLTDVVYWTEGGSVYHVTDQCSSLKHSANILHGSVEEALMAKKERICKTCS